MSIIGPPVDPAPHHRITAGYRGRRHVGSIVHDGVWLGTLCVFKLYANSGGKPFRQ